MRLAQTCRSLAGNDRCQPAGPSPLIFPAGLSGNPHQIPNDRVAELSRDVWPSRLPVPGPAIPSAQETSTQSVAGLPGCTLRPPWARTALLGQCSATDWCCPAPATWEAKPWVQESDRFNSTVQWLKTLILPDRWGPNPGPNGGPRASCPSFLISGAGTTVSRML